MKRIITFAAFAALAGQSFAAIIPADQLAVNSDTVVASTAQLDAEFGTTGGIDDTYAGQAQFDFTIENHNYGSGPSYGGFQLFSGGGEGIGIGNKWDDSVWGGYNGPAGNFQLNGAGGATVTILDDSPETLKVVINYVAGGDDTATITFQGTDNVLVDDFSFDEIKVRCGGSSVTKDFTGMSIQAIPEPATLGLLAVFGGGILFIRRRLMV